jgi:hypothetical protein
MAANGLAAWRDRPGIASRNADMERKFDKFCREKKILIERTGYDHVTYHFHISIHCKYLYVEVPKVASSSLS